MRRIVKELLHNNDVLEESGGVSIHFVSSKNFDRNAGVGSIVGFWFGRWMEHQIVERTIKSVLEERVVAPFLLLMPLTLTLTITVLVGAAYCIRPFCSVVHPGTAKTIITEAVAEKMGWDWFRRYRHCRFLSRRLNECSFQNSIQYVFTSILQAYPIETVRHIVRQNRATSFVSIEKLPVFRWNQSQILTTAMLTAINDLRRTK